MKLKILNIAESRKTMLLLGGVYLLLALMASGFFAYRTHEQAYRHVDLQLNALAQTKAELIGVQIKIFRDGVAFIRKFPPVDGVVRATLGDGYDAQDASDLAAWRQRLLTLFMGYMNVNTDITQVRFIGLAEGGRELYRVNRTQGQPQVVPADALQKKGDTPYFKAIASLKEGEVYVSDITLNREFGTVVTPIEPTIRIGTPVYSDGGVLFGMVVINVNVSNMLAAIQSSDTSQLPVQTMLINADGDYLVHPNNDFSFGFDLGNRHQWLSEFLKASPYELQPKDKANKWFASNHYYASKSVALGPREPHRTLSVLTTTSVDSVRNTTAWVAVTTFAALVILGAAFATVAFYLRSKEKSLLNERQVASAMAQEARFKQVIDASPSSMLVVNREGRIELANAQTERIFGYERGELIGQAIEVLIPASHRGNHSGHRVSFFQNPQARQMGAGRDLAGLHKNGKEFPLEIGLSPIETPDGLKVLASVIDLSDRKRAHEQLQQIVEFSPHGKVITDQTGKIILVNATIERLFGYSRAELLGQSMEILIPDRYRHHHPDLRAAYFNTPSARPMGVGRDLHGRRKDGSEFPLEIGLSPIEFDTGLHVLCGIVDLSLRKAQEAKLREVNERFSYASDAAGMGFWDFNLETQTLHWDDWMFKLYGRDSKNGEQPYTLWSTSVHPDDIARSEIELNDAIAGVREFNTTFRITQPSGAVRYIAAQAKLVRNAAGKATHMFGVNLDVTDAELAKQRQVELVKELTRINEELNNFTYISSHDLKAPLRGIDQLATWVAEDLGDQLPAQTAAHLRLIRSRIKRLERLLEDLLAYSRVGRSKDELVSVNTHQMAQTIFELTTNNPQISLVVQEPLPTILARRVPLELVFRNLFSNAIKHLGKPSGHIWVSARRIAGAVEFSIRDDGPGIPAEHQERVFGMFQTLKPRDALEGSGMGLALVKKSIESNGGTISVQSDGVNGCTFVFTVPVVHNA